MRDLKLVLVLTAYANKKLETNEVGVSQTELCTEWHYNGRGFCVSNLSHYPPKHLAEAIVRCLNPKTIREQTNASNQETPHRARPRRRNDAA